MFCAPATSASKLILLALGVASTCVPTLAADSVIAANSSDREMAVGGVLVLQNGGVLQGRIGTEGDRYVVTGKGSQLEVEASQVAFRADSLADAYEHQRRAIVQPTAEDHLTLAEWCLRECLWTQAAHEINAARDLDARNPKILLLERRLNVMKVNGAPVTDHKPTSSPENSAAESTTKRSELEAVAADLPDGSVERFIRKVQPVLVNNCTTSGCHQASSHQQFQLDRAVLYGPVNRRMTLRNLAATLALVDREAPDRSRLLSITNEPHAGQAAPPFGIHQDELHGQLADWVDLVTETMRPKEAIDDPAAQEISESDNLAAGPGAQTARPPLSAYLAARQRGPLMPIGAAISDPEVRPAGFDEEKTLRPAPIAPRIGAQIAPWQPKDEFDPEIFNRQKKKRPSGEVTSP
jgi:hypothetical protein